MAERFVTTYNEFRTLLLNNIDRVDTKIWVFEEIEYYACYGVIGNDVFRRNVKKGTSDAITLLNDNWSSVKPDFQEYSTLILTDLVFPITIHGKEYSFYARPSCRGEAQQDSSAIAYTLLAASGPTSIMQVFRASVDNVKDIQLLLRGEGVDTLVDDFEYATNTALRNVWVASDTTNTQIYRDTTIPYESATCARISCHGRHSPGDYVRKSFTSQDWNAVDSISFRWRSDLGYSQNNWKVRIYDGTNYAESNITSLLPNVWEDKTIQLSSMVNISSLNLSTISRIEFQCVSLKNQNYNVYIDALQTFTETGSCDVKLYDFGTNATPNSLNDGTLLTLDEGETVQAIELSPNIKIYDPHIHRGSIDINNALVIGNYYGIYISAPTSGKLHIYGSSTKKYNSGTLYTETTNTLSSTTKSIYFAILCIVPTLLTHLNISFDNDPKQGELRFPVVNVETNDITYHLGEFKLNGSTEFNLSLDPQKTLIWLNRKDVLFVKFYDDITSTSTRAHIRTTQNHKPIMRYG